MASTRTSTGSCDFDLSHDHLADRVFFVLGLLNEYNGRAFVEGTDQVEGFYCTEEDAAVLFRRSVRALALQQGLPPEIREETAQECRRSFYSAPIAERLSSCYRFRLTGETRVQGPDGTYRRTARASLDGGLFMRGGGPATGAQPGLSDQVFHRRRALAYLAGAWARFGRADRFVVTNASAKADLIAWLLVHLGCRDVRIEQTVGLIPQTTSIRFEPTNEVTEWLEKRW